MNSHIYIYWNSIILIRAGENVAVDLRNSRALIYPHIRNDFLLLHEDTTRALFFSDSLRQFSRFGGNLFFFFLRLSPFLYLTLAFSAEKWKLAHMYIYARAHVLVRARPFLFLFPTLFPLRPRAALYYSPSPVLWLLLYMHYSL